jgi:hypothetical protein
MSQPDRQEQIADTLSLLSQMTPLALAANRDELFFRAGEASAQCERRESPKARRNVWPAAAAALAILAAGLGAAIAMREPAVRVVYIERGTADSPRQANTAGKGTMPRDPAEQNSFVEPVASVYAANEIRHSTNGDGIIYHQDWAALSDAFARQLRLQQARSQTAREVTLSSSIENRGDGVLDAAPRQRVRSYLELREAMQAL